MKDHLIPGFRRGYRLQWEPTQQSHVVLYPEGMAKLNETASHILKLVTGKQDVATIIATLNRKFPDAGGVNEDVKTFLQSAIEQKWIQCREPE